jgi:hypothetical protein
MKLNQQQIATITAGIFMVLLVIVLVRNYRLENRLDQLYAELESVHEAPILYEESYLTTDDYTMGDLVQRGCFRVWDEITLIGYFCPDRRTYDTWKFKSFRRVTDDDLDDFEDSL